MRRQAKAGEVRRAGRKHHDGAADDELTRTKAGHRKEQYKKLRDPKSAGAKRIRECHVSKITNGLTMLKRAVKQGFKANYVLVDSWFSSHEFIQTVRELGKNPMHLICGVRKDGRKYLY